MLWVLIRSLGASNEYPQHMFLWKNKKKYPRIITKFSSVTNPLMCLFYSSALGAAALNRRLYVLGGYDGVTSLRSVEVYDPETNV